MSTRTLLVLAVVWFLMLDAPAPRRGRVDIGDARIGSNPDEWEQWPG